MTFHEDANSMLDKIAAQKPEYYPEMVFKYAEADRNTRLKNVFEAEKI